MKNRGRRVPKSLLIKMLSILGLKLEKAGPGEWKVSTTGYTQYFSSLRDIFIKYRKAGDKAQRASIDAYAVRIEKAIQ